MPSYNIALLRGDGIGPDIINEAVKVLDDVGALFGHTFNYTDVIAGGVAIDKFGVPLPDSALKICLEADSVLLGAVGGPKWDNLPGDIRPERALLGIRSALGLYANIRPAVLFPSLLAACPLKESIVGTGFDFVVVRELTGGLYYGERGRKATENGVAAYDTMIYNEREIERIGRTAFELAQKRERKKLVSVDKANVLESSRLWREVMHSIKDDYPSVEYSDMLVDNAAMQLVKNPRQFDVIVTENTFGDILSDEAGMITGSIGMLASASLGEGRGLYEPIHGSAPDIAGRDLANPIATILSVAMMLRMSFGLAAEADAIERAATQTLEDGLRTADIGGGANSLGTVAMGTAIRSRISV